MGALEDILLGSLGSEKDYLADSPWYNVGANILRAPTPEPTSNLEAILFPAIQGGLGGWAVGAGKRSALEDALGAYKPQIEALTGKPYTPGEDLTFGRLQSGLAQALIANDFKQRQDLETLKANNELSKALAQDKVWINPNTKQMEPLPGAIQAVQAIEGAKERAKNPMPNFTLAESGPGLPVSGVDERAAKILTALPEKQQKDAFEELGTIQALEKGFKKIDDLMTVGSKVAKDVSTVAPGSILGMDLPTSDAKKNLETVKAGITSVALSVWKGTLDEKDAKRILEPYYPTFRDTPETLRAKTAGLKELLNGNAKSTPILESLGVAQRPSGGTLEDAVKSDRTVGAVLPPKAGFRRGIVNGQMQYFPIGG